jgi:5-formyltetrahydrofolate cyclo-ligase
VNKASIRKIMLEKRMTLSKDDIHTKSLQLVDLIRSDAKYQKAHVIAIYYPMRGELDVLDLMKDTDKMFCFPKIDRNDMHFYAVNQYTIFEQSKFGVMEPTNGSTVESMDYMIVPAIAMSKDKYRIGYGKGYYDRYLATHTIGHTVGVIYDFCEIRSFDVDPHDQALDDYIKV